MDKPTKGSIEAEIANAVVRFQREQQGRGPAEVRAYLIGDMVLVRSKGIFTQTEERLAVSEDGRKLIKSARQELRSIHHREIEEIIAALTGCTVSRSFYDIDVNTGEQAEIYIFESDLERQLKKL